MGSCNIYSLLCLVSFIQYCLRFTHGWKCCDETHCFVTPFKLKNRLRGSGWRGHKIKCMNKSSQRIYSYFTVASIMEHVDMPQVVYPFTDSTFQGCFQFTVCYKGDVVKNRRTSFFIFLLLQAGFAFLVPGSISCHWLQILNPFVYSYRLVKT